jgi:polyhydroxyalkanoate synthesis regulator phasin
MTNHLNEEQLVLYYYGEAADVAAHIDECDQCRAHYQALQRVLNTVDSYPVPERAADYEERVWASVERGVRKRPVSWQLKPWLAAAAVLVLMVSAFFAGRLWRKPALEAADQGVRERVLLVAVGDHLERSQTVLAELVNTGAPKGKLDISYERATASDLVESNRLFRQTAEASGDVATESLLDELEPVLLEIAHSPSEVSARQLEELRAQIEQRGILFKVKVFGSRVAQSNL